MQTDTQEGIFAPEIPTYLVISPCFHGGRSPAASFSTADSRASMERCAPADCPCVYMCLKCTHVYIYIYIINLHALAMYVQKADNWACICIPPYTCKHMEVNHACVLKATYTFSSRLCVCLHGLCHGYILLSLAHSAYAYVGACTCLHVNMNFAREISYMNIELKAVYTCMHALIYIYIYIYIRMRIVSCICMKPVIGGGQTIIDVCGSWEIHYRCMSWASNHRCLSKQHSVRIDTGIPRHKWNRTCYLAHEGNIGGITAEGVNVL